MTLQHRQAVEWLLANKGDVFVLFGNECCTYILNNTNADGAFSKDMNKLRKLRVETVNNTGRDSKVGDWLDLKLGEWAFKFSMLFCCVLSVLRSLVLQATIQQMEVLKCLDEKTPLTNDKDTYSSDHDLTDSEEDFCTSGKNEAEV